MAKQKPKCEKGAPCGFGCIEARDTCRQQIKDKTKTALLDNYADLIAGAAGVAGSAIGQQIAGPAGALAGDALGAVAAKLTISATKKTMQAKEKLAKDEAYAKLNKLEKVKAVSKLALSDLASADTATMTLDELTGFAIGNGSGALMDALVPSIAGVPLKGAIAAMLTSDKVADKRKELLGFSEDDSTEFAQLFKTMFALPAKEQLFLYDIQDDIAKAVTWDGDAIHVHLQDKRSDIIKSFRVDGVSAELLGN